jgi:hypothetical protein
MFLTRFSLLHESVPNAYEIIALKAERLLTDQPVGDTQN